MVAEGFGDTTISAGSLSPDGAARNRSRRYRPYAMTSRQSPSPFPLSKHDRLADTSRSKHGVWSSCFEPWPLWRSYVVA